MTKQEEAEIQRMEYTAETVSKVFAAVLQTETAFIKFKRDAIVAWGWAVVMIPVLLLLAVFSQSDKSLVGIIIFLTGGFFFFLHAIKEQQAFNKIKVLKNGFKDDLNRLFADRGMTDVYETCLGIRANILKIGGMVGGMDELHKLAKEALEKKANEATGDRNPTA